MIKLNRIIDQLEDTKDRIVDKVLYNISDEIDELNDERDCIEDALDYLRDYCE